ncbi:hypothetical protein HPS36_01650 [Halorubrum salinarum]|uniref:Uncharacterized protein n=1 Tax=Halorubrum salinarum TaxID=2739057 RepID=A0A7D4BA97_9EURY|nr:hypothetical protein [Halorubrum salinarum]QKG91611.1 hypothetical protein HPS36_01650 [Halorubrum salinarum]
MVTGFYAALAGAASVFIGILTALLASNLSNLNAQRERIERRIETIDARIGNLDTQYEHFQDTLEQIREQEEANQRREEAADQVDEFIEDHVGTEFDIDPDDLTPRRLQQEFADYLGVDRLNEEQHNVLQEHFEDIQEALTPSSSWMGPNIDPGTFTDSAVIASNNQIEHMWQMYTNERYNRNYRRWIQTMTEIRSLQDERERLVDRHESLDPSRIRGSLRATVVTIVLSVGVPLFAYLLRVAEFTFVTDVPVWLEPGSIFVIWVGGLVYVFNHLREQLDEDGGDIPDEPEISLDDENV